MAVMWFWQNFMAWFNESENFDIVTYLNKIKVKKAKFPIKLLITIFYLIYLPDITSAQHKPFNELNPALDNSLDYINNVEKLSDVYPEDWAYQALKSLVERHGIITGYPDGTFRGNQVISRYEFAAALQAVFSVIDSLNLDLSKREVGQIERLQEIFALELAILKGKVDGVQARVQELEATNFSTTTKLTGQVLFAVNAGTGDTKLDPIGNRVMKQKPQATFLRRLQLDLNTSFQGNDLLKIRLEESSNSINNNTGGFLEPNFGSTLDFASRPLTENLEISKLSYSFSPQANLLVTFGSGILATDYLDNNKYASNSFQDFSTQAFTYNYLLFPIDDISAGAALEWNIGASDFSLKSVYVAAAGNENEPKGDNITSIPGVFPAGNFLYDNFVGDRGLFGDTYQGTLELAYKPNENFALRLQYSGGEIYQRAFAGLGINAEINLSEKFALFGRYGYGDYSDTVVGNINPNYWMFGLAAAELFIEGDYTGVAVGQPFIVTELGDSTQTNIEFFYNFPVNEFIRLTPLVQIITNPGNQSDNDTIFAGTLRLVFSF